MDSKEITDKEGVKETNKLAIITGVQQLLTNPDIKEGIPVSTTILASNGEMRLEYVRKTDGNLIVISTDLSDPKTGKWIAGRDYECYVSRSSDRENPNEVYIEGMIQVNDQEQSRGYGSGLMLCTNIVIEDALRRYPEFRGKLVTAHIIDESSGEEESGPFSRKGWTSHMAKQLGYKEIKEGSWEKAYQYASKNK